MLQTMKDKLHSTYLDIKKDLDKGITLHSICNELYNRFGGRTVVVAELWFKVTKDSTFVIISWK